MNWVFITIIVLLIIVMIIIRARLRSEILIVIGNGFDLYHGIRSSYHEFRDYVQRVDPDVYDDLEKYLNLNDDDQWNNFESSLSSLDAEDLLDEMRMYLGDYGGDWKDSMNHDFQYEVGKVVENLGEKMQTHFLQWILQLEIVHKSGTPRLAFPDKALYLTFNYTRSLEILYKISPRNIRYIHGKALDGSSKIILGHGWENYEKATDPPPLTYEDVKDGNYSTETDWMYEEAKGYVKGYFANSYKNSTEIIRANRHFFKKLGSIKKIYVMGHSMMPVDIKYFEEIAKYIDVKKVSWTVSYHEMEDVENCTIALTQIGINLKLIEFKKLQDFFSPQLSLFTK